MEYFKEVFNFMVDFMKNGGMFVNFLTTPYNFFFIKITPLALISFTGLSAYLGIAVVKWFAS